MIQMAGSGMLRKPRATEAQDIPFVQPPAALREAARLVFHSTHADCVGRTFIIVAHTSKTKSVAASISGGVLGWVAPEFLALFEA